jgi:hypothetical protein
MKRPFAYLLTTVMSFALTSQAAEPPLQPGDYVTERGWGTLKINRDKSGALKFALEAMGGNAHSCGLDGEIRNGRATLEAMDKDKPCVVTFAVKADGIAIDSVDAQICRYFCGMRASFEGLYLKVAPGCAPSALRATRKEFKALYDRKDYAAARAKLEPAFNDCAKAIDWLDTGWIRNDIALVQLRTGDAAACLRTLEPLAKDAAKSDAQIRDEMVAPTDIENWLPVVKAARTNLKLCASALKK